MLWRQAADGDAMAADGLHHRRGVASRHNGADLRLVYAATVGRRNQRLRSAEDELVDRHVRGTVVLDTPGYSAVLTAKYADIGADI